MTQVKHIKYFSPFNIGYTYLFAKPLSLVFPSKEGILMIPLPKDVYTVAEKNYSGYAMYEGYAHILSWARNDSKESLSYSLMVKFLSGRLESLNYTVGENKAFSPIKIKDSFVSNAYNLVDNLKTDPTDEIVKGDLVRVRFTSTRPLRDFVGTKETTPEMEEVSLIHKMPDWYRF
jgi:hypothetical protein